MNIEYAKEEKDTLTGNETCSNLNETKYETTTTTKFIDKTIVVDENVVVIYTKDVNSIFFL